jgi:hypothetical protein
MELVEYRPWGRASALFKFARLIDGQPVVSKDTASFRFKTKLGTSEVVAIFKPKEMVYEGALEY